MSDCSISTNCGELCLSPNPPDLGTCGCCCQACGRGDQLPPGLIAQLDGCVMSGSARCPQTESACSCGCAGGGNGCGCGGACAGNGASCSCQGGGGSQPICDEPAERWIRGTGQKFMPRIPQPPHSPAHVNLANGNLIVKFSPPASGPYDPVPQLTYNSRASDQAIQFGYGWAELYNPTVSQIDSTGAQLINGVGAAYTYSDKDASGKYLAPARTARK